MIDVTQYIPGIIHLDILTGMHSDEAASLLNAAAHAYSMTCQVDGAEKEFTIQQNLILHYTAIARRDDGMLAVRFLSRRSVIHRSSKSVSEDVNKCGRGIIADGLTSLAADIRDNLLKDCLPLEQEIHLCLADGRSTTTTYSRFKAFRRAFMLLGAGSFTLTGSEAGSLSGEELELVGHPANPIVSSALAEVRREWVMLHQQRCLADLDDEVASQRFRAGVKSLLKPFSCDESVLERELDNELRRELL